MSIRDLTQEQATARATIQKLMSVYGIQVQELQVLTKAEKKALIHQIWGLMAKWQIEPWELSGFGRREIPTHGGAWGRTTKLAAKYRHPVSGQEWTGQGRQPQWLKDALTVEGMTVEQLRA